MTFASLEFDFRFGNRCLGVRKGWDWTNIFQGRFHFYLMLISLDKLKYIGYTVDFLFKMKVIGI